MNVSRWTIEERMRLPDFTFGQRQIIGCYGYNPNPATTNWGISTVGLPDPACIWSFGYVALMGPTGDCEMRTALRATIPTSQAEMNDSLDFIPYYGYEEAGPNAIRITTGSKQFVNIPMRRGLSTGGRKLVIENRCAAGVSRFQVYVLVSGLPTNISGWLAHSFFTKAR